MSCRPACSYQPCQWFACNIKLDETERACSWYAIQLHTALYLLINHYPRCLGARILCLPPQNRERASALLEVASAMTGIGIVIHEAVIQASLCETSLGEQRARLRTTHVKAKAQECWQSQHVAGVECRRLGAHERTYLRLLLSTPFISGDVSSEVFDRVTTCGET